MAADLLIFRCARIDPEMRRLAACSASFFDRAIPPSAAALDAVGKSGILLRQR